MFRRLQYSRSITVTKTIIIVISSDCFAPALVLFNNWCGKILQHLWYDVLRFLWFVNKSLLCIFSHPRFLQETYEEDFSALSLTLSFPVYQKLWEPKRFQPCVLPVICTVILTCPALHYCCSYGWWPPCYVNRRCIYFLGVLQLFRFLLIVLGIYYAQCEYVYSFTALRPNTLFWSFPSKLDPLKFFNLMLWSHLC